MLLQDAPAVVCDDEGNFVTKQCDGFLGMCFCVDKRTGIELAVTRKPRGQFDLDCDNLPGMFQI